MRCRLAEDVPLCCCVQLWNCQFTQFVRMGKLTHPPMIIYHRNENIIFAFLLALLYRLFVYRCMDGSTHKNSDNFAHGKKSNFVNACEAFELSWQRQRGWQGKSLGFFSVPIRFYTFVISSPVWYVLNWLFVCACEFLLKLQISFSFAWLLA